MYLTRRRENETARIQEVNDTPVITVLDVAVPPEQRSSPRRTLMVIMGLFVGAVVGIFIAFLRELTARMDRQGDSEYLGLRRLLGYGLPWFRGKQSAGNRAG